MKRALVVGSAGQDGRILTQQLARRGLAVAGIDRGVVTLEGGALPALPETDLLRREQVDALISGFEPDAIFYLAAFHHSSEDDVEQNLADLFAQSLAVHVDGWLNVLEATRRHAPSAHLFYAASSHVFGTPPTPVQNEETPFQPDNAYGITKSAGVQIGRFFRARGLHVSSGILYNHESELRPARFVSQRIARGAVRAAEAQRAGEPFSLELGSLSAVVDWGYAPDYTAAMQRIVETREPGDYVVATGIPHTVDDFCAAAFQAVGLDHRPFVVERPGRITKQLAPLVGNATRLRQATGWAPSVTFEEMVRRLVAAARAGGVS